MTTGLLLPPIDPASSGPVGPPGATGPAGVQGPQGPIGPVGPKGDVGDTGGPGVDGAPGVAGQDGGIGPQGPAGDQGPAGPKGDVGDTGAPGVDGAPGVAGPQGPQGEDGPTGPEGLAGAAGPEGPVGPAGPAGADGADGAASDFATHTLATAALPESPTDAEALAALQAANAVPGDELVYATPRQVAGTALNAIYRWELRGGDTVRRDPIEPLYVDTNLVDADIGADQPPWSFVGESKALEGWYRAADGSAQPVYAAPGSAPGVDTPEDHGVTGDGSPEDRERVIQWLASPTKEKRADGQYLLGGIDIPIPSGVTLKGNGTFTCSATSGTVFRAEGSAAQHGEASAVRDSYIVEVDDSSVLAPGDWIILDNVTDGSWYASRDYYRRGEHLVVREIVDATHVAVTTRLRDDYTDARLWKVDPWVGDIDGLDVVTAGANGFDADYSRGARFRVRSRGSNDRCVGIFHSIDWSVDGETHCAAPAEATEYGVVVGGCQRGRLTGRHYARRHAVTIGSSRDPENRSAPVNRDILVHDAALSSDVVPAADCHANCDGVTYWNCDIDGGVSAQGANVSVLGGTVTVPDGIFSAIRVTERMPGVLRVGGGAKVVIHSVGEGNFISVNRQGGTVASSEDGAYLVDIGDCDVIYTTNQVFSGTNRAGIMVLNRGGTGPFGIHIDGMRAQGDARSQVARLHHVGGTVVDHPLTGVYKVLYPDAPAVSTFITGVAGYASHQRTT